MPVSTCRGCDNKFTGVGPFDAHQRAIPSRPFVECLPPSAVGLVLNERGRWGGTDDVDIKAALYVSADARPDADFLVECRDCGKEFLRPRTRGRPPVKCDPCKGK